MIIFLVVSEVCHERSWFPLMHQFRDCSVAAIQQHTDAWLASRFFCGVCGIGVLSGSFELLLRYIWVRTPLLLNHI